MFKTVLVYCAIALSVELLFSMSWAHAQYTAPRCEIKPLPNHELLFSLDGDESTRWHCGKQYPRPFFYPLNGPSGVSLTRMGHPGAPNHDHHRSVWFAHHDVDGHNFWSDTTSTRIRQKMWYAYQDGDQESLMAMSLGFSSTTGRLPIRKSTTLVDFSMSNTVWILSFLPGDLD